ncbi:MAG: hypothetical protein ACXW31_14760 [Thermoanaerobaculia bacterium]
MLRTSIALLAVLLASAALAQWDDATQTFTPSDGQVVLYDNYQCKGEPFMVVQRGRTYNDFRSYHVDSGNWNDRVSCIHVGPNTNITIYQHIKYGGSSKTFNRTRSNPEGKWSLSGNWWDNSASSCKVP